ncbi:MAG: hypothetical protein ACREJO_10335 [Phycisphaerales bacterium]
MFSGLCIALEVGFRFGRSSKKSREGADGGQIGAVQGAVLGLLGLLLGFSFAGASARFLDRQDLITTEANAIGTAYLRADLLDEPHRTSLRAALQRYTEHRIAVSPTLTSRNMSEAFAESDRLQGEVWRAAAAGCNAKPAVVLAVLPPVNDVIDVHSLRVAAGLKHLPALVLGLLFGSSLLAMFVMGYGSGFSGRRMEMLNASLMILIGLALWTTVDLDHPRAGLLRLSDEPLKAIRFDAPAPKPAS